VEADGMVSLVIVSHSAKLAAGVRELVEQVTQGRVMVADTGAVDGETLGTSPSSVLNALDQADTGDGTLVLMDLGSAIITTEMVLEQLPVERRRRVLLCEAPLVEGAVVAAAQIAAGATLEEAASEARGALHPKYAQLGVALPEYPVHSKQPAWEAETVATVTHPLGLHAGPASLFVRVASRYQATVWVRNLTRGCGPVSGKSMNALSLLDVRNGHAVVISGSPPDGTGAVEQLKTLVESGFAVPDLRDGSGTVGRGGSRPAGKAGPGAAGDTDTGRENGTPTVIRKGTLSAMAVNRARDAVAYVEKYYFAHLTTATVARALFLHPNYFCRVFKTYTGLTFSSYLTKVRLAKATELLLTTDLGVSDVASRVGFKDPNYFSRVFKRELGVCPLVYRRDHSTFAHRPGGAGTSTTDDSDR